MKLTFHVEPGICNKRSAEFIQRVLTATRNSRNEFRAPVFSPAARRFLPLALLLLSFALLFGGCLSRPSLSRETFAFSTPPESNAIATNGPVLGIRRIFVASPFDLEALTYRTGEFSYERDPYAAFLASPEESLAEPIRGYLRASGYFRAVPEPDSALKPDIELEVTVTELYGDFRGRAHPVARLQMRFVATQSGGAKVLLEKVYSRDIPLQARTAAAVVKGWNEALKQITTEAAQDLNQAMQAKPD